MKTQDLLNLAQVVYYLSQAADNLNKLLPKEKERSIRDEYPDFFRDPTICADENNVVEYL